MGAAPDSPAPVERSRPAPLRWASRHPVAVDSAVAVLLVALGVAGLRWPMELEAGAPVLRSPDALAYLATVALGGTYALRRLAPRSALGVSMALFVLVQVRGYPDTFAGIVPLVCLYSVAAHCPRPEALRAGGAALVAMTALLLAGLAAGDQGINVAVVVSNVAVFTGAGLLGDTVRNRRELLASLRQRAADAQREQVLLARAAVEAERGRIARELHDVVAHSVSVMVVQIGGARRLLTARPERAAEVADTLAGVEEVGREALGELRRLLGVLHRDDDPAVREPQPGLGRVASLVDGFADTALDVHLAVEGDRRDLPPALDLSAYRVVQEALTNALKHAGPASVDVRVVYGRDALDIAVCDDGRGASSLPTGAGLGLAGMRERLALFGGTVHAGPRPGGGFQVLAHLPLPADAGAPAGADPAPATGSGRAPDLAAHEPGHAGRNG